ncbi:MAG: saccharopine dehydrogenase NADP-binding domain-containing protein [Ilumatobacter sp.]|uniref:saccharopine dehydrogenase family protein n=1 Tax=Ilumatobacter sp. TaxID=1967498 RepID=UPI00260223FC|nr:saccharopine dehydrogenase NADP-binding domain-containing protein [Ilumatobacter sp.]MDJ0770963.1 saccharopine dehydrogenase NADP-binding domain-containing protein [Ilumatobacter sp.]
MSRDREFDVIVFGATGFTGRLVAEYLVGRYGVDRDVSWAMAGRSQGKLEAVRDEIGAPPGTPLVVADSDDAASLTAMAERTRCVLTTVGPYLWYGEGLVRACAETGTDSVDLSGEVLWMRQMIDRYHEQAVESGARIVHSTGFDSIPFDLGVLFLQQAAEERFGNPCQRVRTRVMDMRGEFSGGTAAAGRATVQALQADPDLFAVLLDPFALADGFEGPEQPDGDTAIDEDIVGGWSGPFFMAPINTRNIHRSNALMGHRYGEDFQYDEMLFAGPGDAGRQRAEAMKGMAAVGGDDDPAPGEGPSREVREAGGYELLLIGSHADGGEIRARVTGDKDPGYGSTSKIIAEAALCLIDDRPDTPGGIWTPAAALGERLIPRLVDRAGMTFDLA